VTAVEELLARHQPVLKYDSQECYFADSAAQWTDNRGHTLVDGNGKVLAKAGDGLSLAFLGPTYADGRRAARTHLVGCPTRDYAEQARRLHAMERYANRTYGHAVTDAAGDLWLQYWFFYFFNDYNLIGSVIKAGLHEGDWEMIQIRLRDERPDHAVYAQHGKSSSRDWRQVDVVPGAERPIVYVARGSHAAYFEPGAHWTGHWFDRADAKRKSRDQRLEIVVDDAPEWRWMRWPGAWGDTKRRGGNPLDADSPNSPGCRPRWEDPLVMLEKEQRAPATAPASRVSAPPAPRVRVDWADGRIRVRYRVLAAAGRSRPTAIVVTLNSPDESAPPTTESFPVEGASGEVELATPVDPARRYDVYVSAATAEGVPSESVRVDLAPAVTAR